MFTVVEFSEQQSYNKVRKVKVYAIDTDSDTGEAISKNTVLEICRPPEATGRVAWTVWLPQKMTYTPPYMKLAAWPLTYAKTLQRCKKIAERLVLSAGTRERLEELRMATTAPEWVRGLKTE